MNQTPARGNMNFRPVPLGEDREVDHDQNNNQPQPIQTQNPPITQVNPTDYWKNLLAVRPDNIKINTNPYEVNIASQQPSSDQGNDQGFQINGLSELKPIFETDPIETLDKLLEKDDRERYTNMGITVFGLEPKEPKKEASEPEKIKQPGWKDTIKDFIDFKLFFKEAIKTPKSIFKFLDFRKAIFSDLFSKQMVGWGEKKSEPKKEGEEKKPPLRPFAFRTLGSEILRRLALQRKSVNQKVGFSNDSYEGTVGENFQVRTDIAIMMDKPSQDESAAALAARRSAALQSGKGKKGVNQKGQFEGSTAGGSAHTSAITAGG